MQKPTSDKLTTTLTCYNDNHGYGWHHVDLFVHDEAGHEINWVHWQVDEDGPEAADKVTARVEPDLRRVTGWKHAVSAGGMDYWTAEATWAESGSSPQPEDARPGSSTPD